MNLILLRWDQMVKRDFQANKLVVDLYGTTVPIGGGAGSMCKPYNILAYKIKALLTIALFPTVTGKNSENEASNQETVKNLTI